MYSEVDRREDLAERARLKNIIDSQYPRLPVRPAEFDACRSALIGAVGYEPRRAQDRSDLAHVAYAAAAGVPVVISRDNPVLRRLRPAAAAATGVTVMSPEDLVAFVDEAEAAPAYRPADLLGTGYTIKEAGAADDDRLRLLFDTASGEKLNDFQRRLRALAAQRPLSSRLLISDPAGQPAALVGLEPRDGDLKVSLLRLGRSPLQATLAAQVGSLIRACAGGLDRAIVRVDDPHAHPLIREALHRDGYFLMAGQLTGMAVRRVSSMADLPTMLESMLVGVAERGQAPWLDAARRLSSHPTPELTLALERQLRPLCIVDAPVPTWLVPIKPEFAGQLFGYPLQLLARPDELGISVEHVYYRGGRNGETAPGRILWYVSGPRESVVMGRSELVEVLDGPWEQVFRQFRRLGVYRRHDVRATADRNGNVRALRVVNTEVFDSPLPLNRLKYLATQAGARLQLRSPWRVPTPLFESIIREVHA